MVVADLKEDGTVVAVGPYVPMSRYSQKQYCGTAVFKSGFALAYSALI